MHCPNISFCLTDKQVRVELAEVEPPKKTRSSPITVQTSKDLLPNINDYDETNADDFAMEMGLACVVCRCILIISKFTISDELQDVSMHPSIIINIHST